jgi:hypothetical protein
MRRHSQAATSLRLTPRLAQALAIGWATAIAFAFLFYYEGWVALVQFVRVLQVSLPTLTIGPHFATFWRGTFVDAGCVVAILATAFATGAVVIDRWTPDKNLLSGLLCLAVGLWVLSVFTLLAGVISIAAVPYGFLLAGCWLLPAPRRFFHRGAATASPLDGLTRLLLACAIAAALLNLLSTMTPPFEYDELEYHLGAPAEYLKAGRIIALPHNFFSDLPQLIEMLYLLALKTSSAVAAKLLHWSFGVLSAVATYAVAVRLWNRRTAVTAAVLFYSVPFVQDLSQTARSDLAATFFATLAFGALLVWTEENGKVESGKAWLWLSAIAAGCAMATKWTTVPVVLFPALLFVVLVGRSFRLFTVYCLLSALFLAPWLVKNFFLMGNPVYPLFNHLFHSPYWSPEQAAVLARFETHGLTRWTEVGSLIWQISFTETGAVPLLLMTAPLILLGLGASKSARRAGWMFVAAYAGWFLFTHRPWRFLFPVFPLAAMVGGCALENFSKWIRVPVLAVIVVGLSAMGLGLLVDVEDPERVPAQISFADHLLGQVSGEEFVAQMGRDTFEPVVWMNRHLPVEATVLYVGEARTFYARHRLLWSTAFDRHPLDTLARPPTDGDRLWQALRAAGVQYVYVNFPEWDRLRSHYDYLARIDTLAFQHVLQEHAKQIHVSRRGTVWELN